jgi:uncharacterized protein YutE (UPF0331/DUF86 family)
VSDVALVLFKLARLREYAALARRRRPATAEELVTDVDRRDALALALLVAVSEAVDVAMHVCTDEGWGVPDSQRAAFEMLASHSVIPGELARTLAGVAQVRNRIAHGYASMDHERLWSELPGGLDALDVFVAAVAAWCAPKAPPG